MITRRRGCVVAVSSALCRVPPPGFALLAVSKAALESDIRCLATELGPHGLQANVVEASMVDTRASEHVVGDDLFDSVVERTPMGRLGTPLDIAGNARSPSGKAALIRVRRIDRQPSHCS